MHKIIKVTCSEDIKKLRPYLARENWNEGWMEKLASSINSNLKAILIEYPYVDKDYRSTYYNFYAKKGLKYSSSCVRIHFFEANVDLSKELELACEEDLDTVYLGFMVLRPTTVNPLGRSAISPRLLKGFDGYLMVSKHVVHLLGLTLTVKAFPFMSQHTDVAVCAHVACWSILRFYNQRFPLYAEYLTYDITKMATDIAEGGLIPSRGFDIEQAMKILGRGGCYPDLYAKESFDEEKFYRLLYSHVESGFPVFAAMHNRGHAITVVGHGPVFDKKAQNNKVVGKVDYSWDYIQTFAVVDDNHLPYMVIDTKSPSKPYSIKDIDAFIVPLPEKVYFPSEAVMAHIENLLLKPNTLVDLSFIKRPIVRYFLTTASSYKGFLCKNKKHILKEVFFASIELSMPKFIWVAEITDEQHWKEGKTLVTLLFDATANKYEYTPFFVIHDQTRVIVFDRVETGKIGAIDLKAKPTPYPHYENNLFVYS